MTEAEVNDLRARLEKSEATRAKLRSSLIALKVKKNPTAAYPSNDNAAAVTASCAHAPSVASRFLLLFSLLSFFFRDGFEVFRRAFPHPPPPHPLTHLLILSPLSTSAHTGDGGRATYRRTQCRRRRRRGGFGFVLGRVERRARGGDARGGGGTAPDARRGQGKDGSEAGVIHVPRRGEHGARAAGSSIHVHQSFRSLVYVFIRSSVKGGASMICLHVVCRGVYTWWWWFMRRCRRRCRR